MHGADDLVLQSRGPGARLAVGHHRGLALVAALAQHAFVRDIGHHVVRVAEHPEGVARLAPQPQRVIDDHFAAQGHPGEAAEAPRLPRVSVFEEARAAGALEFADGGRPRLVHLAVRLHLLLGLFQLGLRRLAREA